MNDIRKKKIISFLKLRFKPKGAAHAETKALLSERKALEAKKEILYEEFIAPFVEELSEIKKKLEADCTHPKIKVSVEPWHTDDGEGNAWSGNHFIVKCLDCALKSVYDRSEESYNIPTSWRRGFHHSLGDRAVDSELIDLEGVLDKQERKAFRKQRERDKEEQERKQYEKLKEKFEGGDS